MDGVGDLSIYDLARLVDLGAWPVRRAAWGGSNVINDREREINLPSELDPDKLAKVALALLSLTLQGGRVWKALDWDLMNLLHEKGWIGDPVSKAKSVVLMTEGEELARSVLLEHFSASPD